MRALKLDILFQNQNQAPFGGVFLGKLELVYFQS